MPLLTIKPTRTPASIQPTPRGLRLRDHDFETAECEYCRYFENSGNCKVLEIDVDEEQICDAYQGAEGKYKPYKVAPENVMAFAKGMKRLQPYCVAPETRILTTDLRWVLAGDLKVGDKLVGFDEELPRKGKRRDYHVTQVTAVGIDVLPSYSIMLETGSILRCSDEHQWLMNRIMPSKRGRKYGWTKAKNIKPGDIMKRLFPVWEVDDSRNGGYLAGAFDGEGTICVSKGRDHSFHGVRFCQKNNEMLAKVVRILGEKNIKHSLTLRKYRESMLYDIWILNGREGCLSFLGRFRPPRLLKNFSVVKLGTVMGKDVKIIDTRNIGKQEMITLETSTGTFVAEGFGAHNSHRVIGGIDTPVGPLLLIKDTMRPKAHHFSLDMVFSIEHTSREHFWTQSEADKIIKAGR